MIAEDQAGTMPKPQPSVVRPEHDEQGDGAAAEGRAVLPRSAIRRGAVAGRAVGRSAGVAALDLALGRVLLTRVGVRLAGPRRAR